jgi:uncharacterized protein YgbK (DUF1537 family)
MAEVGLDTHALAVSRERQRPEEVPADVEAVVRRATDATVAHLKAGRGVIVHTSLGEDDPRITATAEVFNRRGGDAQPAGMFSARLLGTALGRVVRSAIWQAGVRRLCVAGGDTSSYVARALGIEAVEMIAPVVPGAPLCRAYAPASPADGLEVNFKGGQVGGADYFGVVARGKP